VVFGEFTTFDHSVDRRTRQAGQLHELCNSEHPIWHLVG
jgi:hypothetical protein